MDAFARALSSGAPMVIDGGLATEMEARGFDISSDLWSAELLLSQPDAISQAHRAYLESGAMIIISASYQASRQGFASLGLDDAVADELLEKSVLLALTARDEFVATRDTPGPQPLVAASVGPWGAVQHDGSEYTGQYAIDRDSLRDFHAARLNILDQSGADLLACETIPNQIEAQVLAELLERCNTPAWMSFSCRNGKLISDGSPISECAALLAGEPSILALGVNCTPPQFIPSLVREIKKSAPGKAIVVYPNSGEHFDARDNRWHGTAEPIECAAASLQWVAAGADMVGGCCRMGPAHISAMRNAMNQKEKSQ